MLQILNRRPTLRVGSRSVNRLGSSLESLEDRVVLSAAALAPQIDAGAEVAADAVASDLVTIADITVNDVVADGDQLIANATITGTALGSEFTRDVQIPILLDGTAGTEGSTDILNLSIGPIDLDLLGLNVHLDDCDGGPVTIDLTAETGEGNLLGNLVSEIAGLLDGGQSFGDVFGDLTAEDQAALTTGMTGVLNGVFDELTATDAAGDGATTEAQSLSVGDVTDILHLEVGALDLNLLGLRVQTSDICLDVTAEEGPGNLLGNLLGSLSGLLDRVDTLDDRLGGLADSLTRFTDALTARLGELVTSTDDGGATAALDEVADPLAGLDGLAHSLDKLSQRLDKLDRLVDRLDRQDRLDPERLETLVTRFAERLDGVTDRIADAEPERLDNLVDRATNIVERFADRLHDVSKPNRGGGGDSDDDSGSDDDDGREGRNQRLEEVFSRIEDLFDRVLSRA